MSLECSTGKRQSTPLLVAWCCGRVKSDSKVPNFGANKKHSPKAVKIKKDLTKMQTFRNESSWNSLAVEQLGLHAITAGGRGGQIQYLVPGGETKISKKKKFFRSFLE